MTNMSKLCAHQLKARTKTQQDLRAMHGIDLFYSPEAGYLKGCRKPVGTISEHVLHVSHLEWCTCQQVSEGKLTKLGWVLICANHFWALIGLVSAWLLEKSCGVGSSLGLIRYACPSNLSKVLKLQSSLCFVWSFALLSHYFVLFDMSSNLLR